MSSSSSAVPTGDGGSAVSHGVFGAKLPQGCSTWQRTGLMIAARHGQEDVISRALESSLSQPQLDVVDEHGNTAVMIAAREGHAKVVDMLIAAGADLSVKNLAGQTASEIASTESVRELLKKGEEKTEALLKAVLDMAKASTESDCSTAGYGSSSATSMSGSKAGLPAIPKELAGLLGDLDLGKANKGLAGECPF
eukprot:TRINITY_DN64511_c0_g1_i1.p1 TRINITY_DN64511_c0_g1~~TRINITY_DN64511_c0_g1_i1.p1  ORF type:complete len:195 (-),score=52.93 TRINITY_DN64511_c0_g1_i1:84-668(-)